MRTTFTWLALAAMVTGASAQSPAPRPPPPSSPTHAEKDVQRHRAMAAAHEAAARCFEAGKDEAQCHAELQVACKGLALGKYCGMRHAH